MKTILCAFLLLCGLVPLAAQTASPPNVQRVILFIIDGLAEGAPEKLHMPHLRDLIREGTSYRAMHLPLPGHPTKSEEYPWTCSLPNPMLMSGSPFIGMEGIRDAMIQHRFNGKEAAFVVNARSYLDVSGGFGTYISEPHKPDALVIDRAKKVLAEEKPVFMRVHLQRAGIEGEKVGKEQYADQPYHRNIWHAESLYRIAAERADRHLGEFVAWLKEKNLWEGTVLLICGDHGQADEGWHEPYSPPSSRTPLVVVGPAVAAGKRIDYCEILDIAPTVAWLLGREAPPHSIGRVLREAFAVDLPVPESPRHVETLNRTLLAAHALDDERKTALKQAGFLTLDDLGRWHSTEAGADFGAFVARQSRLLNALP